MSPVSAGCCAAFSAAEILRRAGRPRVVAVALAADAHVYGKEEFEPRTSVRVEAALAHAADNLWCTLVHARIPEREVVNFWSEVQQLARRFSQIPRDDDQAYGFAAGLYPTETPHPPT